MDKNKATGINLKQEVDKVESLKNKIVEVKNRINQIIVRGGVQSTSVAEVPKNITKMIKNNYKKVAYIEPSIGTASGNGWWYIRVYKSDNITIPLNVAFIPSVIYVMFGLTRFSGNTCVKITKIDETFEMRYDTKTCSFKVVSFTKNEVVIQLTDISNGNSYTDVYLGEIIAIE